MSKKEHIYLVPYPKIIFFYPTLLTAAAVAIWTSIFGAGEEDKLAPLMTWIFLGVLGVNITQLGPAIQKLLAGAWVALPHFAYGRDACLQGANRQGA